ncbi:MAG: hypothetical protein ACREMC_02215 [Gemmatimonadales bacterium]
MNRLALVTALLGAAVSAPAGAQADAERRSTWWVTLGAGIGDFGTATGMGAQVSGAYQFGRSLLAARSTVALGDIVEVLFANPGDIIGTEDFGLLFGRASAPGSIHASAAAGVGIARLQRAAGSGNESTSEHFGVPLEAQLFWRPTRVFGVGLYGYGNLNNEQSFWGLSVSVQLGRLR